MIPLNLRQNPILLFVSNAKKKKKKNAQEKSYFKTTLNSHILKLH